MLQEIAEIYLSNAEMYPNNANADIYQLCWLYILGTANDTEINILKKYFGI
jgi:hypothetical protein